MPTLNYIKDVEINPDDLDIEWLGQAALGRRYGENAALAKRNAALAEERIKVTRAELIREANADPEGTTGKEKPTSADIEAYYRTHPKHKQAKEDHIQAQYEADVAQVAHMEISLSRKAALENLVKLHGQQYFAGPRVPRDLSKEWENRQHQHDNDAAVAEAIKTKRRR
jgi:hypothetical protein